LTIKKLVLVGASPAHLHVLAAFKAAQRVDTDVYLVSVFDHVVHSPMVAGWVAGHYSAEQCTVNLANLLVASHIKHIIASSFRLDAALRQIHLSTGNSLHYDALSIDTRAVVDREALGTMIPGAAQHAVFTMPSETFGKLWPKILQHVGQQALRLNVIGAGTAGVELALALQHRFPACRVTLIAGPTMPAANLSVAVQKAVIFQLKKHNITVLHDSCSAIEAQCIHLASGASLVCDIPFLAIGGQAPSWLADSGLDLTPQGYPQVNALYQSTSHPSVFTNAESNNSTAGTAIEANLRLTLDNLQPKVSPKRPSALNLIRCGSRTAIASWGTMCFQGNLAWRLKDVIDRSWIRPYQI
jgi:NADH dehydrogenase FAD-containing subunit